jgi:hypothetical protein
MASLLLWMAAIPLFLSRHGPPDPVIPGDVVIIHPHNRFIWGRIADARDKFIVRNAVAGSGSMIVSDVTFSTSADTIKYIPRALEIGYLSPFPATWFTRGKSVALIGRLVSGVEMSLTYVLEALACVFVYRRWGRLDTWLLSFTTTIGVLACGLVVINLGTLYRMRYSFWILIVVMAASTFSGLILPKQVSPLSRSDSDAGRRKPPGAFGPPRT